MTDPDRSPPKTEDGVTSKKVTAWALIRYISTVLLYDVCLSQAIGLVIFLIA
ncbi:hypothetical protein AtEden1_Chr2g0247351 [Arabidopsis thaliana]